MILQLDVWLTLPDGETVRCGELAFAEPDARGQYDAAFRYTPEYLAHPQRFPLDPGGLPLQSGEWHGKRLEPPLMVFQDALPDDWGRRLLIRRTGLPRGRQAECYLLAALGAQGLGALAFAAPEMATGRSNTLSALPHEHDLNTLLQAAAQFEQTGELDGEYKILLSAGSSPGGARPKALVRSDGVDYLAKFPSVRDTVDMVGLEAATLALARLAGLEVADAHIVSLAGNKRALLVRRFDVTAAGGRCHMLSFQTALAAAGWYVAGYQDLLQWLRQYGYQPEKDVPALFRQMVFNALVGNVDDHLKNCWLLADARGFRLAPSFDLLPDVNGHREHVLNFEYNNIAPGVAALEALGAKWGVSGAAHIVGKVAGALPEYPRLALSCGVPEAEIARFCRPKI